MESVQSRNARIREAWDRAASVGLLGALSLLAGDSTHADAAVVSDADTQDVDTSPPPPAKPAAIVTAQAEPDAGDAEGAPTSDGNPPPPQVTTEVAPSDSDEPQGDADDSSGSSTSLQLIEEQLLSTVREPGLQETAGLSIELPEIPIVIPAQAAAAEAASQGITVRGTDLADIIIGTSGPDDLSGGGGNDQIQGKGGNDNVRGGSGDDHVSGGSGDDAVAGNAGNDTLSGDSGNDTVDGGSGDDIADGGSGNDAVQGGDGNDVVIGGLGTDWLTGGEGADCFQFNSFDDSGSTEDMRDHILDFKQGQDKIDFVKINAECIALSNQSLVFVGLDGFDPDPGFGKVRFQHLFGNNADDDRTLIELDRGDGHGHMQIELHGLFTMTVDDFLL
jgi:hypothetical protein